ncbi:Tigger transposable element-derived protein 3 [Cucumispora dikerogammari]|nr:Tigger transposable element-derived protein 3 [Cucumispora dikerogammari]
MIRKRAKRTNLSIKMKNQILDELKIPLNTQSSLSKKFNVDQSVISRIKKNEKKIELSWMRNKDIKKKNKTSEIFYDIESLLLEFIRSCNEHSLAINYQIIREKAW